MMTAQESIEPFFVIKRLSPEEASVLLTARLKRAKHVMPKSYNITNDDQRYELVRRVLARELTIKEVISLNDF